MVDDKMRDAMSDQIGPKLDLLIEQMERMLAELRTMAQLLQELVDEHDEDEESGHA